MVVQELERVQPQAIEAEASILGAMLLDRDSIGKVIMILDESCFFLESHRAIYRAVVSLYDSNLPVDLVTVSDDLRKRKELKDIGGSSYLADLQRAVSTAANVGYHAKIVLEKALLRKLILASTQIVQQGYQAEESVDVLLDRAEQLIFSIRDARLKGGFTPIKEILKDTFEVIDVLYREKRHITGVPSGFTDIDEKTSGFQKSDLVVVAGRPSMGKTALVLNLAQYAAIEKKVPVAIFSLEMSKSQLVQRMLWTEARVDALKMRTGYLAESDWPKLTTAAGLLAEAPIFIDDTAAIALLELRAKARRLKSERDIGLLVVDYLQLIQGPRRSENRQQEVAEISRSLKALAKELNLPLVAVSQLSRAPKTRASHRPILSDLRESGAIEQDADVVIFVYRPELYQKTPEDEGIAEIIIGKQRNGPTGTVRLAFIKEYTRFENLARRGGESVERSRQPEVA